MRNRILTSALATLALAVVAVTAHAQSTINIDLSNIYHSEGMGNGGGAPWWRTSIATDPDPAPYTGHVEDIQPASYFEYRVNCTTPGLYNVSINCFQPSDPPLVFSLETRPYTANDDPTVTRYCTPDSKDYGQFGTWGSSTAPRVYTNLSPIVAPDGTTALSVPLTEGGNILRIQNVSNRHNAPLLGYPIVGSDLGRTDLRDPNLARWSNLHVVAITLNRVADLPAMGTITGTVTADVPAGYPVRSAIVMANPVGTSPAEVAKWWKWGYYTFTKEDGTYTLEAPAGQRDVKANRASGYLPTGSAVSTVTVTDGGTATANITTPSMWFKDGSGDWNAFPQIEYFDSKDSNMSIHPAPGQNNFRCGWTWAPRKASLIVDVPVSANYEFTSSFTSGDAATATMRVASSLGPATEVVQVSPTLPPPGWEAPTTAVAPNSIFLAQGSQVLTIGLLSGNCDFDGFQLRQLHTPVTVGLVQGTVTDSLTGNPIAGATVTFGGATVTTDASGFYKGLGTLGNGQTFTVTAPFQESPFVSTVDVVTPATTTKNAALPIRPHVELSTANGYAWKALLNTGDAVDYSAVSADESAFSAYTVPGSWDSVSSLDDIYGWVRVHFTLPANFNTLLPGRAVTLNIGSVDDVDKTYINGTPIGQSGSFPNPALSIQPAGHVNPPAGIPYPVDFPGVDLAWAVNRSYTFPASLLTAGDNVIAIKVFDQTAGGGVTGTVTVQVAGATGTVAGTVTAGGSPVAGARVAVSNASGISSSFSMTDATGAFTLPFAQAGAGVVGVTKLGFNPIIKPVLVPTNGTTNIALTTTAVAAGAAGPMYDQFNDNAGVPTWSNKWWAVALEDNSDINNTPTIDQPGYDIAIGPSSPIASSVTVRQLANGHRNAVVSKDRFSKFASVNEAKLVSAKGPLAGSADDWGINTILHLNGNPAADFTPPIGNTFNPEIEIDLEGWRSNGTNNIVQWIVWDTNSRRSNGIVPMNLLQMYDITPANPLTLAINRTGSIYDFFINGTLVHTEKNDLALPDHRVTMYGYHILTENTWDYVAAGPIAGTAGVKGDINASGMLDYNDVINALRIAGGLSMSTSAQVTAGNQAGGDTIISALDAVRIDQALGGKAL